MIDLNLADRHLSVLCIGAHPDDIEIGCGATLLSLAKSRHVTARALVLTGDRRRRHEAAEAFPLFCPGSDTAVDVLDFPDGRLPAHWDAVKSVLEDAARSDPPPDLIFAPRRDDAHQDHRLLAELVPTVWRDSLILGYEIPKWDGDLGKVIFYVPAPVEYAERKIELLDYCFSSQHYKGWWTTETFRALLRLRGIESRHQFAEGFMVDKAVLAFRSG